ncbi:hypothetical protein [Sulfitobacter sp. NAS-14.1]|jgi:hypothetical protein|uniref:hypothetical protein n=1 Tax=Sulfitobacter TaxID=60136 RepID=UPI000066A501|nr:hypothetical protein [Sulfitobacter sp. NAS-14.1]EAP81674.1 hypothetical protein NAS141_08051 [Sulfitobacter sp. NAS-14.1]
MDSGDLLRRLRATGPVEFVDNYLFDDFAWVCPTRSGDEYEDVRREFSQVFGNNHSDIAIVGSGKYGFSMSPDKNFRPFQKDESLPNVSDIDLVVISRALFNETWQHLRIAHYNGAVNTQKYFQTDIFRRFITVGTDDTNDTRYLRDLSTLLNGVRKTATTKFGITQTVKLRVYCTWTDAKSYHVWSLQKLGEQHGIQ